MFVYIKDYGGNIPGGWARGMLLLSGTCARVEYDFEEESFQIKECIFEQYNGYYLNGDEFIEVNEKVAKIDWAVLKKRYGYYKISKPDDVSENPVWMNDMNALDGKVLMLREDNYGYLTSYGFDVDVISGFRFPCKVLWNFNKKWCKPNNVYGFYLSWFKDYGSGSGSGSVNWWERYSHILKRKENICQN